MATSPSPSMVDVRGRQNPLIRPLTRSNFFSISSNFQETMAKVIGLRPHLSTCRPSEESWIRDW